MQATAGAPVKKVALNQRQTQRRGLISERGVQVTTTEFTLFDGTACWARCARHRTGQTGTER